MKFLYYSYLIMFPAALSAGIGDSLIYRHGLLIEVSGIAIDQFGYRYRLSDISRVTFRVNISFDKTRNDNSEFNNSNRHYYSAIIGYEHNIYSIGSASLFVSLGIQYARSFSDYVTWRFNPSESVTVKYTENKMGAIAGIGIEYYFTDQLSIFSHQDIVWSNSKNTSDPLDEMGYTSWTTVQIARTKLGLTFYF